jgi:hypothetical protein
MRSEGRHTVFWGTLVPLSAKSRSLASLVMTSIELDLDNGKL